jgi:hypothetical protein
MRETDLMDESNERKIESVSDHCLSRQTLSFAVDDGAEHSQAPEDAAASAGQTSESRKSRVSTLDTEDQSRSEASMSLHPPHNSNDAEHSKDVAAAAVFSVEETAEASVSGVCRPVVLRALRFQKSRASTANSTCDPDLLEHQSRSEAFHPPQTLSSAVADSQDAVPEDGSVKVLLTASQTWTEPSVSGCTRPLLQIQGAFATLSESSMSVDTDYSPSQEFMRNSGLVELPPPATQAADADGSIVATSLNTSQQAEAVSLIVVPPGAGWNDEKRSKW